MCALNPLSIRTHTQTHEIPLHFSKKPVAFYAGAFASNSNSKINAKSHGKYHGPLSNRTKKCTRINSLERLFQRIKMHTRARLYSHCYSCVPDSGCCCHMEKQSNQKNCSRLIVNEMNNPLICAYCECIFCRHRHSTLIRTKNRVTERVSE